MQLIQLQRRGWLYRSLFYCFGIHKSYTVLESINHQQSLWVFSRRSKTAFDTVWIDGILFKLFSEFGIKGRMWLHWCESSGPLLGLIVKEVWCFARYWAGENSCSVYVQSIHKWLIKVCSQSRKSEFRVFSIVHLNIHNFDVLNQFQQNKVLWIYQILEKLLSLKTKWYPCYHGNHDLLNLKFRKMIVWL